MADPQARLRWLLSFARTADKGLLRVIAALFAEDVGPLVLIIVAEALGGRVSELQALGRDEEASHLHAIAGALLTESGQEIFGPSLDPYDPESVRRARESLTAPEAG